MKLKRTLIVVTVALVMAALMVAMAMPAFARNPCKDRPNGLDCERGGGPPRVVTSGNGNTPGGFS